MGYTNFPNGITSFGVPVFGGGLPPITGQYYHVNPRTGSSDNHGKDLDSPVANFETAEDLVTTGIGDGIVVWSQGNTDTTSTLTAAMSFDKSGVTVVGIHAGQSFKGRSRIIGSSSSDLAYLMDVSGSNNAFYNLHFGNEGDANTALGCVRVTGNRNYFYNCHFVGACHATPAAVALSAGSSYGAHDLLLASSENTFERCTFGDVTIAHTAANANLVLSTAQSKNEFINCNFVKRSTTAGTGAIGLYAAAALNGWIVFKDCIFTCWYESETATANTSMVIGAEPNNSGLLFHNCSVVGWSEIDDAASSKCYTNMPQGNAAGCLGVAAG